MTAQLKVKIVQFNRETGEAVQLFQGLLNGFFTQYGNLSTELFTFRDLNGTIWEDVQRIADLPTLDQFEDPDGFSDRQAFNDERAAAERLAADAVAAAAPYEVSTSDEEDHSVGEEGSGAES